MIDLTFAIGNFMYILIRILFWAILIRAILSWIPMSRDNALNQVLHDITEPILQPIQRLVPRIGMLDLTPMVALIVLGLLSESIPHSRAIPF